MRPRSTADLIARLSPEDRAFIESGFYCKRTDPKPRKERQRQRQRQPKPAPPHAYSSTTIYSSEGVTVRCSKPGCQDDRHRVMAGLGIRR